MTDDDQKRVSCFISYSHEDEQDLSIVGSLAPDLARRFRTRTGHSLEFFVDRSSIGWGEDWRGRIAEGIRTASLLMPVVTSRYFDRPYCREEFLAFHAKVQNNHRESSSAILPLLFVDTLYLAHRARVDPVAGAIERTQARSLRHAWLAGSSSTEWHSSLDRIVEDLVNAIDRLRHENRTANVRPSHRNSNENKRIQKRLTETMKSVQEAADRVAVVLTEINYHIDSTSSSPKNSRTVSSTDGSISLSTHAASICHELYLSCDALATRVSNVDSLMKTLGTFDSIRIHYHQVEIERIGKLRDSLDATVQTIQSQIVYSRFLERAILHPLRKASAILHDLSLVTEAWGYSPTSGL